MWHLYKNTFSLHKKNPSDIFYQKRYPLPTRITLFLYEGCRIIITSASPVWRGTRCLWAQFCKKPRKNAFFFSLNVFQQHFSTRGYLCLNWTRSDQHRAWKYYECVRLNSLLYRPKGGCIELYCSYVLYCTILYCYKYLMHIEISVIAKYLQCFKFFEMLVLVTHIVLRGGIIVLGPLVISVCAPMSKTMQ